ncbi:MAG: U32 family peptidase [Firmicutes bacterium]|nr:U32 family peptidase [Bacillota bacterium]
MINGINELKKNIIKKPELLAPAGDIERLKIAFHYGADAVYLGGSLFGLRANAINFSLDDIKQSVEYAHSLGKKIYVTVNIALHSKELQDLENYLKELDKIKVDAIIVSDPAVIEMAKKHTSLEIHLSTQASTLNIEAVKFFKKQGVTRIVLGREANREEIKNIIDETGIEIETFIHGAMCSSISGRCVLSNFFTLRDSNRGGCSQICRWDFNLLNEKKEKLEGEKPFTFCTKDLSQLKYIKDMINSGIASFKIEGRMRSIYYIATIVGVYRKVIDNYCNQTINYEYNLKDEQILRSCANRDAVSQFYDGTNDHTCQYYNGREEVSNQDFLGVILEYKKSTKLAKVEQRNYFKIDDKIEIFGPNIEDISFSLKEIFDEDMNPIEIVRHPKQIVYFKVDKEVYPNDLIRIKK